MNEFFTTSSPVIAGTLLLLVFLSIATWSIALCKLWRQIQQARFNRAFNDTFWPAQNWDAATKKAQQGKGDMALLGLAGIAEVTKLATLQHDGQQQKSQEMENVLRRQIQNIQRYHERGLAELATIGSTAPFIGLFGTVWGIMHALQDIGQSGSASLDVVAGPIGEALVATAIGIATALPAVLAYNYFLRRLRVHLTDLENFAHDFMRLAHKHHFL